jgi:UDP-N-acetylglucosamine 2-epimerase (non-hydrolysing)
MRKVMSIVGTRPELIKMCRVIALLDQQTHHILVHTGQNYDYGLNEVFFQDLEIRRPDHFLEAAGGSAISTIAEVLLRTDALLEKERPEAVLLYGDTNSGLAVIAAKRRKIPVFHMEAGNRCFDQRVPEELNRKVIDHLSDVNMTLTEHARRYLLAEGLPAELTWQKCSNISATRSTRPIFYSVWRFKIRSTSWSARIARRISIPPTICAIFWIR